MMLTILHLSTDRLKAQNKLNNGKFVTYHFKMLRLITKIVATKLFLVKRIFRGTFFAIG